MTLYPMFVNLKGKKVVIIGGGPVATRKLKGLMETEASLTVVSPTVTDDMREWFLKHPIQWLERDYREGDLGGAHLVVAATNDKRVNQQILSEAKEWQWVNMADGADQGHFQIPAQVKRGRLTLAISTDGASPELSKKIKKDLSSHYGKDYEYYLEFLAQCRDLVKPLPLTEAEKRLVLGRLLDPIFQVHPKQLEVLGDFPKFVKGSLEGGA